MIQEYVQDAIAAERSFERQLREFAKEATDPDIQRLFEQHAAETRQQYEALIQRLGKLGAAESSTKSGLAKIFNTSPRAAQFGHTNAERIVQDLMMSYAVENAEVAMYESLAIAARQASDVETESLALRIQDQERATAEKIWKRIAPAARRAAESLVAVHAGR